MSKNFASCQHKSSSQISSTLGKNWREGGARFAKCNFKVTPGAGRTTIARQLA